MRWILASLLGLVATSCGGSEPAMTTSNLTVPGPPATATVVLTSPDEVAAHVGEIVTLVGEQSRTKVPQVLGVDVDGDDALADHRVRVTGRLEATVVAAQAPGAPIVASRGPGTYHAIVDPTTGRLARPIAE